jgi:hypothetical protein
MTYHDSKRTQLVVRVLDPLAWAFEDLATGAADMTTHNRSRGKCGQGHAPRMKQREGTRTEQDRRCRSRQHARLQTYLLHLPLSNSAVVLLFCYACRIASEDEILQVTYETHPSYRSQ